MCIYIYIYIYHRLARFFKLCWRLHENQATEFRTLCGSGRSLLVLSVSSPLTCGACNGRLLKAWLPVEFGNGYLRNAAVDVIFFTAAFRLQREWPRNRQDNRIMVRVVWKTASISKIRTNPKPVIEKKMIGKCFPRMLLNVEKQ